jgi:iron complex transport system substrate-binding protein
MSSRGPGHDARQMLELPMFRSTPAAASGRLVEMDGNYLLNFGPRAARAARDLMQSLYPELAQSTKSSGQ